MLRGSVWIPDWPVAAVVLAGQARADEPIALYDQRVIALNGLAHVEGVRVGMRRRQAQSLVPNLRLMRHVPDVDVIHFERVVRACEEHIAYISVLEPGLITFLAKGPVASAGSMRQLSENLVGDIAEEGLEAHVGFGEGLLTSILAARQDAHVRHARTFLDSHPVGDLIHATFTAKSRENMRHFISAMEDLGVHRIGDLRLLDRHALATRFGQTGHHVGALIDGGDIDSEGRAYDAHELVAERNADPPLENFDQAAFLARDMAEELAGELVHRGLIAQEITITTRGESGSWQRVWTLDAASARDITDRVRWQLAAWMADRDDASCDAVSAITHISVAASVVAPAGHAQGKLWGTDRASRDAAARAVSRIQGLLGDQAVTVPEYVGGRHPLEAYRMRLWDQAAGIRRREDPWPGAVPLPWPPRVKNPPEQAEILDSGGHACMLDALGVFSCQQGCGDPRPASLRAAGRAVVVKEIAGPWLQMTGWWDPSAYQRQAWLEIVDNELCGYLLCREGQRWWLVGVYQ